MEEKDYYLAFSVSNIGPKRFQQLLKLFKSAKKAWEKSSAEKYNKVGIGKLTYAKFENFKKLFNFSVYRSKLQKAKVEFIPYASKLYPENLLKLSDPPIGLFVKGNQSLLLEKQTIAVVGARKITIYGRQVTENLVSELCSAGFIIVSGMALGVDGVGHKTAIENQGLTIAVLGCGVDCPYPRENEKLYKEILDHNSLIISEYPLGMLANKGTFPARNRIIAGLSSSVLITEAAEDSGSLITADYAIKQGKTVFAVPGNVTSQMSKGSLKLLKQGATMVSSTQDILDTLNIKSHNASLARPRLAKLNGLKLSKSEQKILEVLKNEERTIDEISKLTDIQMSRLSTTLSEMELEGLVRNLGGKFAVKNI